MLVLASASPRRRELLARLSLEFEVFAAGAEENPPAGLTPREAALHLARQKGHQVATRRPGAWVLAADTVVAVDEDVLGKPKDSAEAMAMLERLSGREHVVITAFCLLSPALGRERCEAVETRVFFRDIPREALRAYAESAEPLDKAGAYAIQGTAAAFIERIEGSYSNVVGLPLERLAEVLQQEGIIS